MTTAVPAVSGTLLSGVDILDVPRVADLLERYCRTLVDRITTPAEAAWVGVPPASSRLATLIALKEAAIKTMGGRPAGFRWQTIEMSPGVDRLPSVAADVLHAFAAGVGSADPVLVGCRLTGAGLRCVADRLGSGAPRGAGCYVVDGERLLAAVVMWVDGESMRDDGSGR